ncbi:MAG: MarR family transcriptional regulator [Ignavibacteria bacterium]|nr:MarR family transcriptional regulator [Ignavibacteria bacterium]
MEVAEKILQMMQQQAQPMRPGEIAEAAGIDKTVAEKAIKLLKDQELIYSPKRCFYQAK